jgi:hypothetical protein
LIGLHPDRHAADGEGFWHSTVMMIPLPGAYDA